MNIKVNIYFRSVRPFKDSKKRSEHLIDRMRLRGIGIDQIKEAVKKGAKNIREDGSVISEFRWFRIVYRELRLGDIKKIYPITVMGV